MINRDNWKQIQAYLAYRFEVDLISKSSLRLEQVWLSRLLQWAGDKSFQGVQSIRPSYPQYIRSFNHSPVYTSHVVRSAHRFFIWLSRHRKGFSFLSAVWLDTLKVPGLIVEYREHEAVTLDEVRAMASAPVYTLRDRRIRAAAVFWFLSGIRVGAFVTLPPNAVDLKKLKVYQFPKLGVKTKFQKSAVTFLFDIPDLLKVVRAWDDEIRSAGSHFWFAPFSPDTGLIDSEIFEVGQHRNIRARKDLQDWLSRVDLPYHSPHKFRHGHAVYGLKKAKTVKTLKAVSQNLMHSSLKVTDGIYGILDDMDVQAEISSLGDS
jgi:integrase